MFYFLFSTIFSILEVELLYYNFTIVKHLKERMNKKMTGNHIRGYLYSREIVKARASKIFDIQGCFVSAH